VNAKFHIIKEQIIHVYNVVQLAAVVNKRLQCAHHVVEIYIYIIILVLKLVLEDFTLAVLLKINVEINVYHAIKPVVHVI